MKINHKFLSEVSRSKRAGVYFWNDVRNNFIESYREKDAQSLEAMLMPDPERRSDEEIENTRKEMAETTAGYDLGGCPQFLFTAPARALAEQIDITKVPLEAFKQVNVKAGKIITEQEEFFMWYINTKHNQITMSRYWTTMEPEGEALMFAFSTIDFGIGAIRTNPWDKHNQELDKRMQQYMFFLFLADNEQREIKSGSSNGLSKKQGKILNETSSNIIEVRSDYNVSKIGMVSGHWRNQPYGPREEPKYKLIYIDSFKKEYKARGQDFK